jgi:hypothetical protein
MNYIGEMRGGVVVFPAPVPIPEGTKVEVALHESAKPPTHFEQFQEIIGQAVGLPEDMALNVTHYLRGGPKQ